MRNFILSETLGAYKSAKGMAWISIAVSFVLILIFGVSLYLSSTVYNIFQIEKKNIEIDVYIKGDIPEPFKNRLYEIIKQFAGVEDIDFISKEDALKVFSQRYPQYSDILGVFSEVPFPESYVIQLTPYWKRPDLIRHLVTEISVLPGVDEVYAGSDWIAKLSRISMLFIGISLILLVGLFLAISYVIYQTIRLIINARKELIEILDLVGATKSTIEIPYLINGTIYGFLGGLFAAIVLKLVIMGSKSLFFFKLPEYGVIYPLLVVIGLVVGLVASYLSFEEILP